MTAAAYTNNFAPPTATTLYVIDTQNDRLLTQNPPNDGTAERCRRARHRCHGRERLRDRRTRHGAGGTVDAAHAAALYTINLTTGAASLVGNVTTPQASDSDDRHFGDAELRPRRRRTALVYAVLNGVTLTSFARNAPAQLSAPVAITGLQSGETVLGIDFRPADNLLYAVGSTARLYTIDVATGAATHVAMLAADAADTTDPFTALNGTNFGVDFNPVADRLRVVSDARQNLRINVGDGRGHDGRAISTSSRPMSSPPPTRRASPRPASTRLLAIDAATGTVQLQNPPNDGVLTTIGAARPRTRVRPDRRRSTSRAAMTACRWQCCSRPAPHNRRSIA